MVNLAIITYAMPSLRGLQPYNQAAQHVELLDHDLGHGFMTFTLTFAGVIQTHMQRVVGGYSYMDVQDQLGAFLLDAGGCRRRVAIGAVMFVYAVLGPVREQLTRRDVPSGADLAAGGVGDGRRGQHPGGPGRPALLPAAGARVRAVRGRLAAAAAAPAQGAHRLRQDPLRRPHGGTGSAGGCTPSPATTTSPPPTSPAATCSRAARPCGSTGR